MRRFIALGGYRQWVALAEAMNAFYATLAEESARMTEFALALAAGGATGTLSGLPMGAGSQAGADDARGALRGFSADYAWIDETHSFACLTCGGDRWVDDPTACGDEEHCSPIAPCPECNPGGDLE